MVVVAIISSNVVAETAATKKQGYGDLAFPVLLLGDSQPRAEQKMVRKAPRSPRDAHAPSPARGGLGKPQKTKKNYELLDVETPRDLLRVRDTALPGSDSATDVGADTHGASAAPHSQLHSIDMDDEEMVSDPDRLDTDASNSTDCDDTHQTAPSLKASLTPARSPSTPTIPCTQVAIVALSAISGFLFGYDLCVMVVALPLIHEAFDLSMESAEAVVSILMVGAVFGSLAGGVLADRVGRKRAIIVTSVFFLAGSVCMTFADSIYLMLLGRFLAGLAVGSSGPCVSTYVAEIADPEHRGALVTINEVMVCFGCLVSVVVSSSLQASTDGWRKMLGLTLIPPLIQLAGMPFVPESPRWLITQNDRAEEARIVLRSLFPQQDADETDAQIKAQLAAKGLAINWWDALQKMATDNIARRRVVLSLLVALAHTLTGANAMLYYSSYIIDSLGTGVVGGRIRGSGDSDDSSFSGVSKEMGVAIAKLAGVCSALLVVDRVGRRSLLLFGTVVMLFADLVFAWSFWILEGSSSENPSSSHETLGICTLYLFIYAWNFSWAPLMMVISSEVLPDDLRSVGMGLTFAVYWLGSSLVNQTLLTTFKICGMSASFLVYGSLTLTSIAFIYLKVPETKGRSFEEITKLFSVSP